MESDSAKVCKKMHKHVFDDGENIDVSHVMKDVYENFNLIFKATISQYENLLSKVYIWGDHKFHKLTKELGFLITFSRCMLKRCVEESTTGPVVNTGLIDILTDIESHFVDLHDCCSRLLSKRRLSYSEGIEVLSLGSFEHMVSRVSNAFLAILRTHSSPSFIHSDQSMVEFLDELLANLTKCGVKDKKIKYCVEKLKFLRNYLQFTKEYWMNDQGMKEFLICVEVVAEIAACYSFLKKYGEFSSRDKYFLIKNHVESEMDIALLKALVSSTPKFSPFTHGLLKGYVDCVQEVLVKLMNDDVAIDQMMLHMKNQFRDLHMELKFLVGFILSNPLEELPVMKKRFQTLIWSVGSLVLFCLNEKTMATETTALRISELLQKAHRLKDNIMVIVLLAERNKKREMEGRSVELVEVRQIMQKHMFDEGNISRRQVMMKGVYENFNLMFKATISQYKKFESKVSSDLCGEFLELRKELGFLITFSRCMLKRCVEEGATGVIDILTDVESHFVRLFEQCSRLLSQKRISLSEQIEILRIGSFEHMESRVSNAFLAVLSSNSSPSSFIHIDELMGEFLDQLLEDLNQCDMEDKNINTSFETLEFLRKHLEFTKEHWMSGEGLKELLICVEVVAEIMACYSFLKKYGKFSSHEQYLQIKVHVESELGIAVLKALSLKSLESTNFPLLTDGLLKGYVGFLLEILPQLINDDTAVNPLTLHVKNLPLELDFLVGFILNYPPEKLGDIRRQFQILVGNVGTLVLLSLNKEAMETETTALGIPDLLKKAYHLKDQIMVIILLARRKEKREMEGLSVGLAKVCKKMHKHVFDCENINLSHVMKEVYENFNLIFRATISQYRKVESQAYSVLHHHFIELRKELGFLITFSRCMMKRCVEDGDTGVVIDTNLVDILTDVESHFADLLEHCSTLLSNKVISPEDKRNILCMGSLEHMESRVSNAFLAVLSTDSSPISTGFMHSNTLMIEFLDQLLEDLTQCDVKDKTIKASIEILEFMRNYLQLTKEYCTSCEGLEEFLIYVEFVAENVACYCFLTEKGELSTTEQYLQIKNRVESEMDNALLKTFMLMKLQDSIGYLPLLTDALLKIYVDFVQEILTKLINDDDAINLMTPQVKNQFQDLHKVNFQFLVGLILNYPLKELADMRRLFQTVVGNVGSLVLLFFDEGYMTTETTTLEVSDLLQQAHLLKGHMTDIILSVDRKKEREMTDHSIELDEVRKRMRQHLFDAECIELHQVIAKDVYENFTLIFKATISQHEKVERGSIEGVQHKFPPSRKELGFLITFSRCMLNRCVEEGTAGLVINTGLIDTLSDVESHFVDLHDHCSGILSRGWLSILLDEATLSMGRFEHMVPRISNAFLAVFNADPSALAAGFIHSYESMVEFLGQLLEDLNQCDMEDKYIKISIRRLNFLRDCLEFAKEYCLNGKGLKVFLTFVQIVAESAACYSFLTKCGRFSSPEQCMQIKNHLESETGIVVLKAVVSMKIKDSTDHFPPLTDGLLKSYVDCVQENLTKLINDDLMMQVRTQFEDLHKDFELLVGSIDSHPVEQQKFSDIRTQFQSLVLNVAYNLLLLFDEEIRENEAAERTCFDRWQDFLEESHLLRELINHMSWPITFGRIGRSSSQINQLGFLNFLIDNLRELKEFRFSLKTYEVGGFQDIHEDLVLLRSFLQHTIRSDRTPDDETREFLNRIRCAASAAEHFINSYVFETIPDCCKLFWFSEFQKQVKLIKSTFADISEKRSTNEMNSNDIVASSGEPRRLLPTSDVVVGFEEETELIKERLVSDSEKLDVISIIGMAGLGKTTFAKKLYEDPSVVDRFQLRSWCTVSQEYNKKELLLTILACMVKLTDDTYKRSEGDLSKMLYQQLTGSRYLIVMDDIWGMDALRYLKRFFPDNRNGSRIMLTSRNRLEDYNDHLELGLLTDDESWNLMKQKIYEKNEECPPHLRQVGEKIAKKCRGLPLVIVVVAGILAKSEKKRNFWEKVAGNLSLYISGDTTQAHVMAVLELSYKLLPENLKPLFLYLGAFPEDTEIPANKLAWLWIAEGFLHKTGELKISLEVEAELNLMDLIDRSLVMIAEKRSDGRVKSCRVHDMLRDMCLVKAKEENFMRLISVHADSRHSVTYERRLSISLTRGSYLYLRHERTNFPTCRGLSKSSIAPPLSSFLLFNVNKTIPLSDKDIMQVFHDFRLLRIMHSESLTIDENMYRDHVVKLIHLKYISIRTAWNSIPSSISKLWNLETLIIRGFVGEILVPKEIWELVKLRHLHINSRANFRGALLHESFSKLENLQSLSTPVVCWGEEKKLMRRIPNLRKFRFISAETKNSKGNFEYQLPQLESLDHLESLKILCDSRMQCISAQFGLPSSLKKLSLLNFRLEWSQISSFHKLPNLEVLKLRGGTFVDALWDMEDFEFSALKFLKLESLNIKEWIVSPSNFPFLKKLVFQSCKKLEEIPSSVGEFYSLEKLEVLWCSADAANSAKEIQEEQKDMGNELLKVQIHMSS